MSLRVKLWLTLMLSFVFMFAVYFFLVIFNVRNSYVDLEKDRSGKNLERLQQIVKLEQERIDTMAIDWAVWDDCYNYMIGKNDDFIPSTVGEATMENTGLDAILFFDKNNKFYGGKQYDRKNWKLISPTDEIKKIISKVLIEKDIKNLRSVWGDYILINGGVFHFAMSRIYRTDRSGKFAGSIVMMQHLTADKLSLLAKKSAMNAKMHILTDRDREKYARGQGVKPELLFKEKILDFNDDNDMIEGKTFVNGIFDKPIFMLSSVESSKIMKLGKKTSLKTITSQMITAFITFLLLVAFLEINITRRISKIQKEVKLVGEEQGFHGRISVDKSLDEIGQFTNSLNWMLEAFEENERDRDQLRKQVFHSAKLSSIGELSAGVGHEINNPLAIVTGNLELLRLYLTSKELIDDKLNKYLGKLDEASERIVEIVNGLKTFSRVNSEEFEPVNLKNTVDNTLSLMQSIYRKQGVEIVLRLDPKPLIINGNRGKLQQVITNLLSNAKDATEGREERVIIIDISSFEDSAVIKVIDNGHGIDAETRDRIFDTFFTTKDVGDGTGLGLSITRTLIQEMGGTIELETEVGAGTTFILTFALHESHLNKESF